jgi:hypothetical protein
MICHSERSEESTTTQRKACREEILRASAWQKENRIGEIK